MSRIGTTRLPVNAVRSPTVEPNTILASLSPEPRRLEASAALTFPLDESETLELYPTLVAAQEALGRLADALERRSVPARP